jgi:hypothetical protein
MFGYNYKYQLSPDKGIIKLKPTMGTYAKAYAPFMVFWGTLFLLSSLAEKHAAQKLVDETEEYLNEK